jgi:hypothetical protein
MKKKLISGVLALSMLCGTAFMAACGESKKSSSATQPPQPPSNNTPITPPVDNRPVDTYTGYLSEDIYATEYDALSSYVARELKGAATIGDIYNYEIGEELSADEISALNIGEVENLLAVRKTRVQYVDKDYDDIKEKDVYLVVLNDGYLKYFAPALNTGDTLPSSYYDLVSSNTLSQTSVTCVSTTTQTISINIDSYGASSANITGTNTWKVTKDVVYCIANQQTEGYGSSTSEYYIVRNPNDPSDFLQIYRNGNNAWELTSYIATLTLPTIPKTDDNYLMASIVMLEFATADHSYFEKTNFGFRMSSDKLQAYCDNIVMPMVMDSLNESVGPSAELGKLNFLWKEDSLVDFYLKDNLLTKYDSITDCTATGVYVDMTMDMYIESTLNFSNYGTTVVTIPAEVQQIINNY